MINDFLIFIAPFLILFAAMGISFYVALKDGS
ncbi:hypothetical protein ACFQ4N_05540 [Oceanobacillus iheyensis]